MLSENPSTDRGKSRPEATHNPLNYMKTGSRRIIIKERSRGQPCGRTNSTIAREIVIKELDSSEKMSEKRESGHTYDAAINCKEKDASPSSSATRDSAELENTSSPKSTRSQSPTLFVTFDPQPKSRTILSKAATPSAKAEISKSLAVVTLSAKDTKPQPSPNHHQVQTSNSTQEKVKAYQEQVDEVPRIFKVLPDDCPKKYERFTYLPGVKIIPSHTPSWKIPILQKKNKDVIDHFLKKLYPTLNDMQQRKESERKLRDAEKLEQARQDAIPEWKKPMVKAMEQKKKLEQQSLYEKAQMDKKEVEKFNAMPPWRQELVMRKKEQERLDKMPTWQKDLIVKKKVSHTKAAFENSQQTDCVPWAKPSLRKTQRNL